MALEQSLEVFGLMNCQDGVFNADPIVLAELTECTRNSFPRGAGHRSHLLMREQERETESAVDAFTNLVREFK